VSNPTTPADNPVQFTAGDGPGVLRGFVSFGLSICHEVLFPELIAAEVAAGAQLLVNVSNDGWIDAGQGIAGRQHLVMAALRAVETRRYLVRAATTGPSAVIDPYGRILDSLPPRTSGVLTGPVAARTAVTPYVYFGDAFAFWCVVIAGLAVMRRYTASIGRYPRVVPASAAPLAVGRTAQPR
jgi:apolipoprotein N-acyltransferase